jgi:Domain of unknown function (DUF4340)
MRFRSTLILALVFLALGVYLYFVEFERAAQEGKKEKLFDFAVEDVQRVTLEYADHKITVERVNGGWKLTAPIEAKADETTVDNLVHAIADCEVKKTLDDVGEDLSPYGLDHPNVVVQVALEKRDLPVIRVGKTSPVGFSTYVQRGDESKKVFLTTSAFKSGMEKQVKDLRNKNIVDFQADDVRRVALERGTESIVLTKTDDVWRIEKPAAYDADSSAVRNFLTSLTSLRAKDFPSEGSDDLTPFGLDAPRLAVDLAIGADGAVTRLLFGKETTDKSVYVKLGDRPTIFTVGEWGFRDADKKTADFRDKTILAAKKDDVREIRVDHEGGGAFSLKRGDDGAWKVTGADASVSEPGTDQFLDDLLSLKGYEIVTDEAGDLAQYGLEPASLKIALLDKDGKLLSAARFGKYEPKPPAAEYTAMREGSSTVYHVREYQFTRIDKSESDFLPKPTPAPTMTGNGGQ